MNARTALITGGEGTLALAICACLQADGWTVHAPGKAQLDVTCGRSVQSYVGQLDRLDLLINNAGVIDDALIVQTSEAQWQQLLAVNLDGAFRCTRAALPLLLRQPEGSHIINVGSFAALQGTAGQGAYAAAKAGLVALTQTTALEHGAENLRCNCVLPGFLETKMTSATLAKHRSRILQGHALGRLNTVEEAARFIVQLDSFLHVSGQVFQLDSRVRRWA